MFVPRQQYPRELKIAVMREIDSGKSTAWVARNYQLSPKRLEVWKSEWRAKGELAFPGIGTRPQPRLDAERIAELERKIGQQAMEIDFLKKALRHFREQAPPIVGNGAISSTSKSAKPRKRRPQ
jgi:transposase-like protein